MPRLVPISWQKLVKVFEEFGWKHVRTKGDHLVYEKEFALRPVIIPKYKQIPEFIILKNLKTAGISRDECLEMLGQI